MVQYGWSNATEEVSDLDRDVVDSMAQQYLHIARYFDENFELFSQKTKDELWDDIYSHYEP